MEDSHIRTSEEGLSDAEALTRLKKYGRNELRETQKRGILTMLWEQITDTMVLILIAAAALSAFLNEWAEAVVILVIVAINALISIIQEKKAANALEALRQMSAPMARVMRQGEESVVASTELVPGDVVFLEDGCIVPADIRLIDSAYLKIQEASLTGESVPVEKDAEVVFDKEVPLGDRINMAYTSSIVMYGNGVGVVVGTGMNTEVGQIADLLEDQDDFDTPLKRKLNSVGKTLSIVGIIVCVLIFGIGYLYGRPLIPLLLTAISLAISIIPEGLPATATIVMALGVQRMARKNALVRKLPAVETLGSATVICSDKTGTLTKGVFEVCDIHHNVFDKEKFIEYAALAESASSHPVAKSIRQAHAKEINTTRVSDIVEHSGKGICAKVDEKNIVIGNDTLMKQFNIQYVPCHTKSTIIHMAVDSQYAGHIVIADIVKPESKELISALKKEGINKITLLSGDNRQISGQVAQYLGIQDVHSELLPAQKVQEVEKLLKCKAKKETLAFVGDGMNDAPVLSRSDIGIAMGSIGSDAAIEAADIVLMDDNPLKILTALRISRKCMKIVYQNIWFALSIKIFCLMLGALGLADMWLAVFADVGVMVIAVFNAIRALSIKNL